MKSLIVYISICVILSPVAIAASDFSPVVLEVGKVSQAQSVDIPENISSSNGIDNKTEKTNNDKKVSLNYFTIENAGNLLKKGSFEEEDIKAKKHKKISEDYDSTHCDESDDNEKFYYHPFKWLELNFNLF